MDCNPPASSVHGISQARILERVAISFSRRSSQPRNWIWVSCIAGGFFTKNPPMSYERSPTSRLYFLPFILLFLSLTGSNCLPVTISSLVRMYLPSNSILRRRQWQPIPVLLPEEYHGWRSMVGRGPWGREESDTTERLHFHFSLSRIGEGNGNPLQCSCLENPRDGGAWWAAVYGVAQSRKRLKRLSSSSSSDLWNWACSHMLLYHLCIFFGEVSIQIFCLVFVFFFFFGCPKKLVGF